MIAYIVMALAMSLLLGMYIAYFIIRTLRFWGLEIKKRYFKIGIIVLSVLAVPLCLTVWGMGTMIILHVTVVSGLIDIFRPLLRMAFRNRQSGKAIAMCRKIYGCGMVPIIVTAVLLIYGSVNMNHVVRTVYDVETDKAARNYKIVLITDTHYGTIQNTEVLKRKIADISAEAADIVILGGDIVEEGSSKEAMQEVFELTGKLETTYGVYFVYGNHDRQPYTNKRSYTEKELESAITSTGITILEDSCIEINGDLILAGRADAQWGIDSGRLSTEEILGDASREKYIIIADHQPVGAEENDAQGVDLELSGHTHAAQIWPGGIFSELSGILNYGEYQEGICKVIVSSGFAGWGYPIRTSEHCEYVVINIRASLES